MPKTSKTSVEKVANNPLSLLFPETVKSLRGPNAEQQKLLAEHQSKLDNQLLMTALRMAGIAAMAGGGAKLLQEGYDYLKPDKGLGEYDDVTIDIKRPRGKVLRRKRASLDKQSEPQMEDMDMYYPAMLGATGLGLYGGYKGFQALSDWLKNREMDKKIEQAKKEFEEALDERYQASSAKFASLRKSIDSAYDKWLNEDMEKEATVGSTLMGTGIGAAALLWLLSHKAAYKKLRSSDPERFQKKVLEHQRRVRQAVSPPPVLFDMVDAEDEDPEKDIEKEASAPDHSCGACQHFNGGTCGKQSEVMAEDGEDNLTIYLSKPTQPNSCSKYAGNNADIEKEALSLPSMPSWDDVTSTVKSIPGAISDAATSAVDAVSDFGGKMQNTLMNTDYAVKGVEKGSREAAQDPSTLKTPLAQAAGNPNVQQGMNQAAMKKVQSIPVIGSMFGA